MVYALKNDYIDAERYESRFGIFAKDGIVPRVWRGDTKDDIALLLLDIIDRFMNDYEFGDEEDQMVMDECERYLKKFQFYQINGKRYGDFCKSDRPQVIAHCPPDLRVYIEAYKNFKLIDKYYENDNK